MVRRIPEGVGPWILFLASTLFAWLTSQGLADMVRDLGSRKGPVAVRGDRVLGFIA